MHQRLLQLLLIGFAVFVASPMLLAQDRLDQLIGQYQEHFDANRIAEAEQAIGEATELAKKTAPERAAHALFLHSNLMSLMERFDDAGRDLNEALQYSQKYNPNDFKYEAWINLSLGRLRSDQGKYHEAEQFLVTAVDQFRKLDPSVERTYFPLSVLGDCYEKQGKYLEVEKLLLPVLPAARRSADPGTTLVLILSLANVNYKRGRYNEAERYYREAIDFSVRAYGWDHSCTAEVATVMSRVYVSQLRYGTAIRMIEYALPILERVHGSEHSDVALARILLSSCYSQLGRPADAIAQREAAVRVYEKLYPDGHLELAEALANLGYCYYLENRVEEGESKLRRALEMTAATSGADSMAAADVSIRLARVLRDKQQWAEAESLIKRSIALRTFEDLPAALRMECHQVLAEIQWATARQTQALQSLETAMQFADTQRAASSGSETERAGVFASLNECFEIGVRWYAEMGNFDAALRTIERMRARAFLDELSVSNADLLEGRTKEERTAAVQQEAALRGRISFLEQQLEGLPASKGEDDSQRATRQKLTDELGSARGELYSHWRELRDASPVYRDLISVDRDFATVAQVRDRLLKDRDILFAYLIGRDGGYVAIVSQDDARVVPLSIDASQASVLGTSAGPLTRDRLEQVLMNAEGTGVVQQLSQQDHADAAVPRLAALWHILVPEPQRAQLVSGEVKHAIVLPDGPLALLPLEVLVTKSEGAPEYLLDVGPPLTYGPSATVLCNLAQRQPTPFDNARPILTLGDPAYATPADQAATRGESSTRMNLSPLPFSGQESRWVSRVFGDAGMASIQLSGKEATEANVRRSVKDRRLLHFACHGLSDDQYGNLFGALALAPGANRDNPEDDGMLTLAEIYDLDLAACDLAILSACMTNYGPQQEGEGTWAISRGFLVAGARHVIASNWVVDDEAGASLVSYFCGAVAKAQGTGQEVDYPACLRDAKRWVRNNPKWKNPFYWATFELIGPQ